MLPAETDRCVEQARLSFFVGRVGGFISGFVPVALDGLSQICAEGFCGFFSGLVPVAFNDAVDRF